MAAILRKHCLDAFRLSRLVSVSPKILAFSSIQSDADAFIRQISEEELGIRESKEEILNRLQQIYVSK